MILSDTTIEEYIDSGKIKIYPAFNKSDIRPTGIRLHLGHEVLIPIENQMVDLIEPTELQYNRKTIPKEGFVIKPGMFVLASTIESIITSPNIVCHLEGRSTIGRLGLSIHCTSGIIDNNHDEPRTIVLEMKNNGTFYLKISQKIPIGMLIFSELSQPIQQQSQSQYRNQSAVKPANLNFKNVKK